MRGSAVAMRCCYASWPVPLSPSVRLPLSSGTRGHGCRVAGRAGWRWPTQSARLSPSLKSKRCSPSPPPQRRWARRAVPHSHRWVTAWRAPAPSQAGGRRHGADGCGYQERAKLFPDPACAHAAPGLRARARCAMADTLRRTGADATIAYFDRGVSDATTSAVLIAPIGSGTINPGGSSACAYWLTLSNNPRRGDHGGADRALPAFHFRRGTGAHGRRGCARRPCNGICRSGRRRTRHRPLAAALALSGPGSPRA